MRKTIRKLMVIPAGAALAIALASPAFADDDGDDRCGTVAKSKWLSVQEITRMAQAEGLKVQRVKADDGCYEIYATDKKGVRIEALFNPETGARVSTERKH